MKAIGILIAKKNSNRFPNKNIYEYQGKPLFVYNIELLQGCQYIEKIYVATDSGVIKKYCEENNISIIDRKINTIHDEQPFLDILRFVYMSLPEKYPFIVTVLANSINHDLHSLDNSIEILLNNSSVDEVRSFDSDGKQSGIFVFRERFLLDFNTTLHPMVAIRDNGKEIHYKEELLR